MRGLVGKTVEGLGDPRSELLVVDPMHESRSVGAGYCWWAGKHQSLAVLSRVTKVHIGALVYLVLFVVSSAGGALRVDFTRIGGPVEAGYQGYFADHESAVSFTEQSFSAFGTTVTLIPVWLNDPAEQAMQMIDRASAFEVAPNPEALKMALKGIEVKEPGIL